MLCFGARKICCSCVQLQVVYPIERMTAMMVELAKNPLKSLQSIRKTLAVKYGMGDETLSFRAPKKSSEENVLSEAKKREER